MPRGYPVKTPERVREARWLRDHEGWTLREIGERYGVATSTVDAWLQDPDGIALRARKDFYAAPCVDCGAPTSGSEGRRREPRCQSCANIHADRKVWPRQVIIDAIQAWAREYGEPPAAPDWNPWHARSVFGDEERAARFERDNAAGKYPSFITVIDAFGSWNAGIKAAGFTSRPAHGGGVNVQRRRNQRANRTPAPPA